MVADEDNCASLLGTCGVSQHVHSCTSSAASGYSSVMSFLFAIVSASSCVHFYCTLSATTPGDFMKKTGQVFGIPENYVRHLIIICIA